MIKQLRQPSVADARQFDRPGVQPSGSRIYAPASGRKRLQLKHYSDVVTPQTIAWNLFHMYCISSGSWKHNILYKLAKAAPSRLGIAYSTSIWLSPLPDTLQVDLENPTTKENCEKFIRILPPGFVRGFSIKFSRLWGSPLDMRFKFS